MEFSFGDLSQEETQELVTSASTAVKFTPVHLPPPTIGQQPKLQQSQQSQQQQQQQQHPQQSQQQQQQQQRGLQNGHATQNEAATSVQAQQPAQDETQQVQQAQEAHHQQQQPQVAAPAPATAGRTPVITAPPSSHKKLASTSAFPAAAPPSASKGKARRKRGQPASDKVEPHYAMHGILNEGNTCYMNAPLQLVFSLPHVREVLLGASVPPSTLCHTLQQFLRQFISTSRHDVLDPRQDVDRILRMAKPISAATVYAAIGQRNPDLFDFSHMQHDAEEVLTFVLSTLHDELLEHCPEFDPSTGATDNVDGKGGTDDGWEEVGPKKTSAKLNEVKAQRSAVSSLVQGTFRSTIAYKGGSRSIVLQPFFVLQADIKPETRRLEEALDATFSPEVIEGVQRQASPASTTARKQLHLERAPPLLLVQLKRYHFDGTTITKLTNQVDFSEKLTLKKSWLSVAARADQECEYHLHGVMFHVGSLAMQGHYTCSVRSSCGWLDFNDKKIKRIDPRFVYHPSEREQAYMLAYVRKDVLSKLDYL